MSISNQIKQRKYQNSLSTFNCNGLKSSFGYVSELANKHHRPINFICEHWLRPHEISTVIKDLQGSVDPLIHRNGRPFGGVGFICDDSLFEYRIIECDSDRICCICYRESVKPGNTCTYFLKLSVNTPIP